MHEGRSLSLSLFASDVSGVHLQHLSDLHDYNTLLAVVGGLNHFSIRRLTQTWAKVDKSKREVQGSFLLQVLQFPFPFSRNWN